MLAVCSRRYRGGLLWSALAIAAIALPLWQQHQARRALARRLARAPAALPRALELPLAAAAGDQLLASWQTVGGCGSGATTGSGGGVKWIGPVITGGMFNVLSQATYLAINDATQHEYHLFVNTLISKDLSEKWNVGVSVPLIRVPPVRLR